MRLLLLSLVLLATRASALNAAEREPRLITVQKIWDAAPHNAFTDLIRFQGKWLCVFREGRAHVSPDGALRVIESVDGVQWHSSALLQSDKADLRDAKITLTPDGQLMLCGAGALHPPATHTHESLAWFSEDGRQWSKPVRIGDENMWLWRVSWHKGTAYSIGYETTTERFVRLYSSSNGREFKTLVPRLFDEGYPNESSIVFQPDDTAVCLLRRDGAPGSGQIGTARPPYLEWQWKDLGVKLGGPHMIQLPDGRLIAAVRLYDRKVRTSVVAVDAAKGVVRELLPLPSGGDTSYAGLVWHENVLWVSYYSSHEAKTSIYLAKVEL